MVDSGHMEIEDFFAYRAGYTRKNGPKSHTYVTVLQTVTYAATFDVFKDK